MQIAPAIKHSNHVYSSRSLLRYPGGKTRAIDYITNFFPQNTRQILSPFIGGGSIELSLASKGITVYGYDIFEPLVEFWQCLSEDAYSLAEQVNKHYPLTREKFYKLQQKHTHFKTKLERAAVYYVLNRSSFSGATLSGGMSPGHPRFTMTSISRLKNFYNPNIIVNQADFKESLEAYPGIFTYLDPPYLIKSSLYGKKGNAHKDFDHAGLADMLYKRKQWIMSYNDCKDIRELYAGFTIITPAWKYGMSTDKSSKEILIFSKDLHPNGKSSDKHY